MEGGFISGYLLDRYGFQKINPPEAVLATATGLNNRKQAVGTYFDSAFEGYGYLRSPRGVYTTLRVPGSLFTEAWDINNRGMIVGGYDDAEGGHGYIRDRWGNYRTFDFPGPYSTLIVGINDRGDMVGITYDETFATQQVWLAIRVRDADDELEDDEDDRDDKGDRDDEDD